MRYIKTGLVYVVALPASGFGAELYELHWLILMEASRLLFNLEILRNSEKRVSNSNSDVEGVH